MSLGVDKDEGAVLAGLHRRCTGIIVRTLKLSELELENVNISKQVPSVHLPMPSLRWQIPKNRWSAAVAQES